MPTLEVSKKDLEKLVGKKLSEKEIEEHLMFVKGEIDGQDGDTLKVDVKETNRPDLWSTEGIAREIKARTGKEKGTSTGQNARVGFSFQISGPWTGQRGPGPPMAAHHLPEWAENTREALDAVRRLGPEIWPHVPSRKNSSRNPLHENESSGTRVKLSEKPS